MTAANIQSATGVIVGDMAWSVANFNHVAWVNKRYTGSETGKYVGELDNIDAFAAENQGMTVKEFRAIPSAMRDTIRKGMRNLFYGGSSPGKMGLSSFLTKITGTSYKGTMVNSWDDASPIGLQARFDGDLAVGIIPELSDVNVSQSRKDAINYWWPRAATKLALTKAQVAEIAKPQRRERAIKIETVLKAYYDKRVAGYSVTATIASQTG